jgi:PAS domain S-box-containing protein
MISWAILHGGSPTWLLFGFIAEGLAAGNLLYSALFGAAALACVVGAWYARNLPARDARHGLMALLIASGLWAGSQFVFLLADTVTVAYAAYTAGLVVGFSTVWTWLYFCSAYSGRTWHRQPVVVGGSALVVIFISLLKLTNPQHGLYFGIDTTSNPLAAFVVERRILYWNTTLLSYILALGGFAMLIQRWRQVRARTTALVGLFGIMLIPILGNVAGFFQITVANLYHEPLGVAAFAIGTLVLAREAFITVQEVGRRNEPALVLGQDDTIRAYNKAAEALFPSLAEKGLDHELHTVLPDVNRVRTSPRSVVTVDRDGSPQYYRLAESHLRTGATPIRLLVLTDITERERQFREQQQLLQTITESVSDGLFQISFEEGVVYANQAMAAMMGYDSAAMLRKVPHKELLADPDEVTHLHDTLRAEGEFTDTLTYRRRDGSRFAGRVNATLIRNDNGTPIYYNGTVVDLTEQKQREQALRAAKEEAETAARLKETMLMNMSHEIRTPLTSILGFSQMLTSQTSGTTSRFAERIHRSGKRLERTLEAVLTLSKLRSGTYTPHPESLHLFSVIEETLALFKKEADNSDIALTALPKPPSGPHIDAYSASESIDEYACLDADGFRQILRHLVDNAIKFTPAGGSVTVCAYRVGSAAHVVVEDTGSGIESEAQEMVFEAFKQESEGASRSHEGSGLGLAIVQQFVERMGGTLSLNSTKGKGSRFAVELPHNDRIANGNGDQT